MFLSIGYFIYDTIACVYYGLWDGKLLIHHFMTSMGLGGSSFTGKGGCAILLGIVIAEISNFPMHMRQILKNHGLRHTRTYEYLERLYFTLYIIARGIFSPVVFFSAVHLPEVPIYIKLSCFVITAQSVGFISKMFKIIQRKID